VEDKKVVLEKKKAVVKLVTDKPVYGGELVILTGSDFSKFDPADIVDTESMKITANIFDTLVEYSDEEKKFIPSLAEKWEISESGTEWKFYIRRGIKFHDGTILNAEAVKFNFERWSDLKNQYHNGNFYYWQWMFGGFPGIFKAIEIVDEYTVKIRLKVKYAPFLSVISGGSFGISSPEAIKKSGVDYLKKPVGTGPFIFEIIQTPEILTLKRNEFYWKGKPYLDKITFRKIIDSNLINTELKIRKVDMVEEKIPGTLNELKKSEYSSRMVERESMDVCYLAFNTQKKPFDNSKIREAISIAIDKDEITKTVYGENGRALNGIIPDSVFPKETKEVKVENRIETAKKMLKQAGYKDSGELKLWVMEIPRPYIPSPKIMAEVIKNRLEEIGIKTEIVSKEWNAYLDSTQAGEHDLGIFGWRGDNIDPDNFIYPLFSLENSKDGMSGNLAFYKNNKMEALLNKGRLTFDEKKRTEIYMEIEELIKTDNPIIPISNVVKKVVVRNEVKNYKPSIKGYESFYNVWKK
jgi:peptide/nickel transport system substrate-binding protein